MIEGDGCGRTNGLQSGETAAPAETLSGNGDCSPALRVIFIVMQLLPPAAALARQWKDLPSFRRFD